MASNGYLYGSGGSSGPPYTVTYKNTTVNTTGTVPVDPTQYAAGATVTVMGNTGNLAWTGFTFKWVEHRGLR